MAKLVRAAKEVVAAFDELVGLNLGAERDKEAARQRDKLRWLVVRRLVGQGTGCHGGGGSGQFNAKLPRQAGQRGGSGEGQVIAGRSRWASCRGLTPLGTCPGGTPGNVSGERCASPSRRGVGEWVADPIGGVGAVPLAGKGSAGHPDGASVTAVRTAVVNGVLGG